MATPWRPGSPASTARGSRRCGRPMAVDDRSATPTRSSGASSPRPHGCRTASATARRRGAWARCGGPCATPGTGCPRSAPARSGAPCARPAWAGSAAGPGARPAPSRASAGTAVRSRSPTTMPPRKKVDRAGLRARPAGRPGGLVRGRGRAVPGRPAPRRRPVERPAIRPLEYVRQGTTKILTLFHPATGQVRVRPAARGTNAGLHGWLKETLAAIVAALPTAAEAGDPAATRALWEAWQQGLAVPFTLPERLPPLRVLLVWDNLAGHKTPEMVLWLCRHGIMPLYTPLGGSWLNMAESIQRILKRRALDGQHPSSPAEIGAWFEQTAGHWNRQPTPFVWNGKRRQRRRRRAGDGHPVGGSAALTYRVLPRHGRAHQKYRSTCQLTH